MAYCTMKYYTASKYDICKGFLQENAWVTVNKTIIILSYLCEKIYSQVYLQI